MLGQLIKQANNSLIKKMNSFARQYNLTGTQMSVIDYLGRRPQYQCEQKEIETEFAIKRSSTTVLIQRLIKKDLLKRHTSNLDNRKKLVQLTEKGRQLLPIVSKYIAEDEEKITQQYSAQELKIIKQFLTNISQGGKN